MSYVWVRKNNIRTCHSPFPSTTGYALADIIFYNREIIIKKKVGGPRCGTERLGISDIICKRLQILFLGS